MDHASESSIEAARPIVIELSRRNTRGRKVRQKAESVQVGVLGQAEGEPYREDRPLVLEYNQPKTRRASQVATGTAKFSPELRDLQVVGTDVVRATHKAALALVKGIDTYEQARLRSMQAKKDGALEDFITNASKAISVWMKEASDIPLDLSAALRRTDDRRRERRRKISRAVRRWRE